MPLGALFAREDLMHPAFLRPKSRHFIVAFGGGALVSAVALVLVPEGASKLSPMLATLCFSAGGIFFYFLDSFLSKLKSSAGQLVAMLSGLYSRGYCAWRRVRCGKKDGFASGAAHGFAKPSRRFQCL